MRNIFPEQYKMGEEELKAMWNDCLFAIDANVLLSLYRYPVDTRTGLLTALEKVQDRLWLPFQAAMEFQRNRAKVVADQKAKFQTVKTAVDKAVSVLKKSFAELNLQGRHARISVDELQTKIESLVAEFQVELAYLDKQQPDVHEPDPLREKIDALFEGKVGPAPDQHWVDANCKAGKDRYRHKTPPGFMDHDKPDYSFLGVRYEGKYGDLFVWQQVIEKAVKLDGRPIVMVTDDDKEDWWQEVGGKTIGPLPELVAEMKREGKASGFHIYKTDQFMGYAKQFSHAKVDEGSISDVREINKVHSSAGLFASVPDPRILTVDVSHIAEKLKRRIALDTARGTATAFLGTHTAYYDPGRRRMYIRLGAEAPLSLVRWLVDRINESTEAKASSGASERDLITLPTMTRPLWNDGKLEGEI